MRISYIAYMKNDYIPCPVDAFNQSLCSRLREFVVLLRLSYVIYCLSCAT